MTSRPIRLVSIALLLGFVASASQLLLASAAAARVRCGSLCAVSDDDMVYRVTSYFTFRAPAGEVETAVGFTITNRSRRAHVFAPLPGGFTAVTTTGQYIQVTAYQPGRKGCYVANGIAPPYLHQDPSQYRIKPGHTRVMKLMCMIVPSGQRLAKVQFADNNAYRNAVVELPPVANLKPKGKSKHHKHGGGPAPKTHKAMWWLPNPCQVTPQRYMIGPRNEYTLTWSARNTSQASALCQYTDPQQLHESFYIGYVPPPFGLPGSATITPIVGWPGAALSISTRNHYTDPQWFWAVTFHRRFDGHVVYGEYFFQGESCTSSEPYGAIVLKALYDAFGPPAVSVPPRYELPNQCYMPPTQVRISSPVTCPASSPTACLASAKITTTVITRGRHPVATAARAARRVRYTVVIATASVVIEPGHQVVVNLRLNLIGRQLMLLFPRLPTHVVVKIKQGHKRVRIVKRKLTIKATRVATR